MFVVVLSGRNFPTFPQMVADFLSLRGLSTHCLEANEFISASPEPPTPEAVALFGTLRAIIFSFFP